MPLRLIHGFRRLAATSRQYMTSAANPKAPYRPSKRHHKNALTEDESHLNTSFNPNPNAVASKRLRRSESFESRPTSPDHRLSTTARSSNREQGSFVTTYRGPNQYQRSDYFRSSTMPRGSERSGRSGRPTGRGRGRGHPEPRSAPPLLYLDGPVHDEAFLRSHHLDDALPPLKERWLENPKSTISNYHSLNFGKQPVYEVTEGMIERRKMYRYVVFLLCSLFLFVI
jgi:hypothetical protein